MLGGCFCLFLINRKCQLQLRQKPSTQSTAQAPSPQVLNSTLSKHHLSWPPGAGEALASTVAATGRRLGFSLRVRRLGRGDAKGVGSTCPSPMEDKCRAYLVEGPPIPQCN